MGGGSLKPTDESQQGAGCLPHIFSRCTAPMNYEIIDQLRPGEEVVVVGVEGDWYQITVPEKNGYVHSDYLELIEKAEQNSEMDMALLMMFMSAFMQNTDTSEPALTPDGNLTLIDDVGSPTKSGKQFITAVEYSVW